jgi:hypothetical protein
VRTVLALRREPPQMWEPLFCMLTMKGKSPWLAATPPTIWTVSWGMATAMATAGIARAARDWKCILTRVLGVRVSEGGVDLNRSEWMILEESCLRGTYRSLVFLLDRLVVYNSLPIWCRPNFQDNRDNVVDFSFQLQPRSGTVETKQSIIPAV